MSGGCVMGLELMEALGVCVCCYYVIGGLCDGFRIGASFEEK